MRDKGTGKRNRSKNAIIKPEPIGDHVGKIACIILRVNKKGGGEEKLEPHKQEKGRPKRIPAGGRKKTSKGFKRPTTAGELRPADLSRNHCNRFNVHGKEGAEAHPSSHSGPKMKRRKGSRRKKKNAF